MLNMAQLPKSSYLVHNDMQELEHLISYYNLFFTKNKNLQIIPILVPYINYETIESKRCSSDVVSKILKKKASYIWKGSQ
jgi:hypothetical protein